MCSSRAGGCASLSGSHTTQQLLPVAVLLRCAVEQILLPRAAS